MNRIRVAILGQGRSGRDIHGSYLSRDKRRYEIVAVVEPLPDRRRRAAEEFNCEVLQDHRPLLKRRDLELIVNATPSHLHVPITLALLRAGFNVLCEKPLAAKAREADRLIAAAEKAGKVLAIFQQNRYGASFQQVRKVIASGVLGRIVQVCIASNDFRRRWDWQTLRSRYGGSLLNTGAHLVDQALQLFGTDAMPEVSCHMDRANSFGDAEDHVLLALRGRRRPLVTIEISSCCAYPSFTYNVYGTRGGLKASGSHVEWKYFKPGQAPRQRLIKAPLSGPEGTPVYCREELTWQERSWDAPKGRGGLSASPTGKFYTMLHNTLTRGARLDITPREVRQQIAVIEQCHRQNPQIWGKAK